MATDVRPAVGIGRYKALLFAAITASGKVETEFTFRSGLINIALHFFPIQFTEKRGMLPGKLWLID